MNRCSGKSAIVDYETVKGYLKNGSETLVIDVRKPSERLEPGRIPNTKNVPRKFTLQRVIGKY